MKLTNLLLVLVVVAVGFLVTAELRQSDVSLGGFTTGNAMLSTTTPNIVSGTNLCGNTAAQTGVLGSITLTGTGSGGITILDATTTNVALRTGNIVDSKVTLASIPKFATSTTYEFNVRSNTGLVLRYESGVATATITYRCRE